ncbi:MAG: PAS domain S-box protein [Candidatus Desulfatibia sp.]|uniref:PAS domain-containing protein n=1 Tax=Candidatus Desulfatibia sp. TaxID=3101189 RepID=UPI002F2CAA14
MTRKQTYEELEQKVKELEEETIRRKRAEEALIVGEERYRNIIEDQTEFIVRWLPGGIRTFVNESYCRFFGKTRDEVIGSSFFPLVSEEDRKTVEKRIETLTPDCPVSMGEHRVIRPDGTIGWNQWVDRAIFDENGQVVEYQSVGRDITERKQAEEALVESEERLKSFYHSAFEGVAITEQGKIIDFNRQFADLFGYERDELIGREVMALVAEEDRELVLKNIRSGFDKP